MCRHCRADDIMQVMQESTKIAGPAGYELDNPYTIKHNSVQVDRN
jgi:hypothetical protein